MLVVWCGVCNINVTVLIGLLLWLEGGVGLEDGYGHGCFT
jgi:hypothetical protein